MKQFKVPVKVWNLTLTLPISLIDDDDHLMCDDDNDNDDDNK